MGKLPDFTGMRFGRLVVIKQLGRNAHHDMVYLCQCDCGNTTAVIASSLNSGNTRSCGFLHGEFHGCSDDRLYSVWQTMKARCRNKNSDKYKDYGGRGIRVCDEWVHSFSAFRDWALENGYDYDAPYGQCTLDRIDVDGDYCPDNCRWADAITQASNKRPRINETHGIEVDYREKHYISLSALAREYGFHSARLERRIHRMTIDEAMEEILKNLNRSSGR